MNVDINKVKHVLLSMQRASWEQGVSMQSLWEYGDIETSYLMAKEAVSRQTFDGRLSVVCIDNGITDPAASGEVVFRMGEITGEYIFIDAWKKMLNYLLNKSPKNKDGILYHFFNSTDIIIDSMYMLPPFLCSVGYYTEAIKQIEGYRKLLWNKEKKLFSHSFNDEKQIFSNRNFWGVGNGWSISGYARVIDLLPEKMRVEKTNLIRYVIENIDGCLSYWRLDGLFNYNIDDDNSFVETNLAQMIAYSIYRGIKSKWLNESYFEKAEKMRNAVHLKVDKNGYVNGVCAPPNFNSPGTSVEGQAFFILMESARNKLF